MWISVRLVIGLKKKESLLFICFLSFFSQRSWYQTMMKECIRESVKVAEFNAAWYPREIQIGWAAYPICKPNEDVEISDFFPNESIETWFRLNFQSVSQVSAIVFVTSQNKFAVTTFFWSSSKPVYFPSKLVCSCPCCPRQYLSHEETVFSG